MENTKIYLGLIAVWVMVAWMAWEFAWDAWQNARREKRQRQALGNERHVPREETRELVGHDAQHRSDQAVKLR